MVACAQCPPSPLPTHNYTQPENVLLESGTNKVKLADFGLAKNNKGLETIGIGTPAYMVRDPIPFSPLWCVASHFAHVPLPTAS